MVLFISCETNKTINIFQTFVVKERESNHSTPLSLIFSEKSFV